MITCTLSRNLLTIQHIYSTTEVPISRRNSVKLFYLRRTSEKISYQDASFQISRNLLKLFKSYRRLQNETFIKWWWRWWIIWVKSSKRTWSKTLNRFKKKVKTSIKVSLSIWMNNEIFWRKSQKLCKKQSSKSWINL